MEPVFAQPSPELVDRPVMDQDHYLSGNIWNLESCADDAKSIKRWMVDELGVPKQHIAMLLDERATKQNIEVTLNNHLLHNNRIQKGDAILIYFAGHGSTLKAPHDWLLDGPRRCNVEVLCTYDHDTKGVNSRIAGISARAMHTFLHDLSKAKGNNITLIIDSCFSPPSPDSRDRSSIRWTSTSKAAAEDLYHGSTGHACPRLQKRNESFYSRHRSSHTVITACKPGTTAAEGKDGGKFTSAFLEIMRSAPLHITPSSALLEQIRLKMAHQIPHCSESSDYLFDRVPFSQDPSYIPVLIHNEKGIRIELGSQHGIQKGGEFSLHAHNYSGSRNPTIATVTVQDVYSNWCTVRSKCALSLPRNCWARHNQKMPCACLRKMLHALYSTAFQKASHLPPALSISDIKDSAGKSELIETAEAILASRPLLAPLMK
ncbi:hypothetical protein D9757_004258 [Collybiopsis confluens]|uniref:Peptidase C14 caspase domain-containing protein n=1 Tax=Collybiopsis confluens TaxID=2823264 RepID=A0A8H5HU39_9AGAR|nr:hypothetical protein D9757_004258 [Collybiopsis confluens]